MTLTQAFKNGFWQHSAAVLATAPDANEYRVAAGDYAWSNNVSPSTYTPANRGLELGVGVTPANYTASAGAGMDATFRSQSAFAGSAARGGDLIYIPGAGDGAGRAGRMQVSGILFLNDGGTTNAEQWANGVTAAVSEAATGRIRYNDTTKTFQYSSDTAAYVDFGTGSGTVGPGTINRVAKFTAATVVGDSGISDDATTVTVITEFLSVPKIAAASFNEAFGASAGAALAAGAIQNTFVGKSAGNAVTTGDDSTFVGYNAGLLNTASQNTFVGSSAGAANVAGTQQVFVGYFAGKVLAAGGSNTFLGYLAGQAMTSADRSVAIGNNAGGSTVGMSDAVVIGHQAGISSTALGGVFIGSNAGGSNTTGARNMYVGYRAGVLANGDDNTLCGYQCGDALTSGSENVALGVNALGAAVTAGDNTAIGFNAGLVNTGDENTFVGAKAGSANIGGTGQCFMGYRAGTGVTTGSSNTALGHASLDGVTTGSQNTAVGKDALGAVAAAMSNSTAVGYQAGLVNTANENTFIGSQAGTTNVAGTGQVFVGFQAGQTVTGGNNAVLGYQALRFGTTASSTVAVGFQAIGGAVATAAGNVAVGTSTLYALTSGSSNVAVGNGALINNSTGINNIGIGLNALSAINVEQNNIGIGTNTVVGGGFSKSVAIGYAATVGKSNAIVLGGTGADAVQVGIGQSSPGATLQVESVAGTTGSPLTFYIVAGAHTGLTAGTIDTDVDISLDRTKTWATGAIAQQADMVINGNSTYAFVGASTVTLGASVVITGGPSAGANATITDSIGLLLFGTGSSVGATTGYALKVVATDGAATNYAGHFTGDVVVDGKLTVTGSIDPTDIILSGGTAQFMEYGDGSTAAVSGATTGRIRFNAGIFEVSEAGAAYVPMIGGGSSPPFIDTTAIVKGSGDPTKLLRFEVDGFTTATTRVMTPPDADILVAGQDFGNTFTVDQNFGANVDLIFEEATSHVIKVANQTTPGGSGGGFQFTASNGGAGAGATPGGNGGPISMESGWGGAAGATGAAGNGNSFLITAGSGGDGSAGAAAGAGANVEISAGWAGADNGGGGAAGGNLVLDSGGSSVSGVYGTIEIGRSNDPDPETVNIGVVGSDTHVFGDMTIDGKLTVVGTIDPPSITLSGGTAQFMQYGAGSTAPVSAASTGRIRYNESTNKFQVSLNTAAYVDIVTGAGSSFPISFGAGGVTSNVAILDGSALVTNTTGSFNFAAGVNALAANTIGIENIGIGHDALKAVIDGQYNIGIGYQAGDAITDGLYNVAIGSNALGANLHGYGNIAIGADTLPADTGHYNVAIGFSVLNANLAGTRNVGISTGALAANTTGGNNLAIGFGALASSTTTSDIIGLGQNAGSLNTAAQNIFIGASSGAANTAGTGQVYIGYQAGLLATSSQNTVVGFQAFAGATSSSDNVVIGFQAMGGATVTGDENVAIGSQALSSNTGGDSAVAIGFQALQTNGTGDRNVALGYQVMQSNVSGSDNVAIGYQAMQTNTGSSNIGIGSSVMNAAASGNGNIGIGGAALQNLSGGTSNIALGGGGLFNLSTGTLNISIGDSALGAVTTETHNIAIGDSANVVAGVSGSVAIGYLTIATASNMFACGSDNNFITDVYFGGDVASVSPTSYTIHAASPRGGTDTDTNGASVTLAGGLSTGSGIGGSVVMTSSTVTGTSSTLNASFEVGRFSGPTDDTLGAGDTSGGLAVRRQVEQNTATGGGPNSITAVESWKIFTNQGATAENVHNLPTPEAGLTFTFVVQDVDGIKVNATGTSTIRLAGSVSSTDGYVSSANIGDVVIMVAINASEWIAISIVGSWTLA